MTWNQQQTDDGPAIGWHWYRETATSDPHPVKVFAVAGINYVWPLGEDPNHPLTVRVEHCTGEFLKALEPPL